MKGRMKRLAVGLLAAILAAGPMAAGVLPQEVRASSIVEPGKNQKGALTIKKYGADTQHPLAGAEFKIWRVFTLTPGTQVGEYAKFEANAAFDNSLTGVTPDALGNYSTTELQELAGELQAEALRESISEAGAGTSTDQGLIEFRDLELGYYLVVETKAPDTYVACAPFLVALPTTNEAGTEWVYEVTAQPKNVQIPFEKTIDKTAQGDGVETDGTVKVGDYVPYKIATTFPTYTADYGDVKFKITDTMSKGLKLINDPAGNAEKSVKVKVNGQDVTASGTTFTLAVDPDAAEGQPDLIIEFASDYIKQNGGQQVEISYYAQVTEDAVTGTAGNENSAKLTYTNKPGEVSEGTPQEVKVYSFGIEVVKFTEKENGYELLDGAQFDLYRDDTTENNKIESGLLTTGGKLQVEDLDQGTYYLIETKSPKGYTLLTNPIKIEIKAADPADGTFTLKINGEDITATDEKGNSGIYQSHVKRDTGIASVAVQNYEGFSLPSTGGMGVTIFLLAGAAGIIVLSIAVMKKKRQ